MGTARIAYTLTGMTEDDAKKLGVATEPVARSHYVRLDPAKSNYAALEDAQWFEKVPYKLENGEQVPAAEPWTPPEVKAASQADLAALVTAIKRGAPTASRSHQSCRRTIAPFAPC